MENFLTCQHFTSCKGQKHLDKNLYLQLQYSIYSESNNYLSLPTSLSHLTSFSHLFVPQNKHKLKRLMNCLGCLPVAVLAPIFLCWLECRTMNIQPEIMLAIGAIYVKPVPVRQLELSFRDEFYAHNQTSQERSLLKCRPARPLCWIAPTSIALCLLKSNIGLTSSSGCWPHWLTVSCGDHNNVCSRL